MTALNFGSAYPKGDQDALFDLGDAWKKAAADLEKLEPELKSVTGKLPQYYNSDGATQVSAELATLFDGKDHSIQKLVESLNQLGHDTRATATEIEYTKIQSEIFAVLTLYTVLQLSVTLFGEALVPGVLATARESLALFSKAAMRRIGLLRARAAMQTIAKPLIREITVPLGEKLGAPLAEKVVAPLAEKIAQKPLLKTTLDYGAKSIVSGLGAGAMGAGLDAGTQVIQIMEGHRDDGFDLKQTFQTSIQWGAGGAIGAPAHVKLGNVLKDTRLPSKLGGAIAGGVSGVVGAGGMYGAGLATQLYDNKGDWNKVDTTFHSQLLIGGLAMGVGGGVNHGLENGHSSPGDSTTATKSPPDGSISRTPTPDVQSAVEQPNHGVQQEIPPSSRTDHQFNHQPADTGATGRAAPAAEAPRNDLKTNAPVTGENGPRSTDSGLKSTETASKTTEAAAPRSSAPAQPVGESGPRAATSPTEHRGNVVSGNHDRPAPIGRTTEVKPTAVTPETQARPVSVESAPRQEQTPPGRVDDAPNGKAPDRSQTDPQQARPADSPLRAARPDETLHEPTQSHEPKEPPARDSQHEQIDRTDRQPADHDAAPAHLDANSPAPAEVPPGVVLTPMPGELGTHPTSSARPRGGLPSHTEGEQARPRDEAKPGSRKDATPRSQDDPRSRVSEDPQTSAAEPSKTDPAAGGKQYLSEPHVSAALGRADELAITTQIDGVDTPVSDVIRDRLPQHPELTDLLRENAYLEHSLLERLKTLASLLTHPDGLPILHDAVDAVAARGPEPVLAEPIRIESTPLTPEQRAISHEIREAVGDIRDSSRKQPGFDYTRVNDPAYQREFLQEQYDLWRPTQDALNDVVRDIAKETEGKPGWREAPKDEIRALDKIKGYDGDVSRLTDLVGAKIVFDHIDDAYRALEMIENDPRVRIVEFEDRFDRPAASGYRDLQMKVQMDNGHIAELRLHLSHIDAVADFEHGLYEVQRDFKALAKDENREMTPEEAALSTELKRNVSERFWEATEKGLREEPGGEEGQRPNERHPEPDQREPKTNPDSPAASGASELRNGKTQEPGTQPPDGEHQELKENPSTAGPNHYKPEPDAPAPIKTPKPHPGAEHPLEVRNRIDRVTGVDTDPVHAEMKAEFEEFYQEQNAEAAKPTDVSPRNIESPTGEPSYEARRFSYGPDEKLTTLTVKVHLDEIGSVPTEHLRDVMDRLHNSADRAFNTGERLLSGDRLRVELEFVDDPAAAHLRATVGEPHENSDPHVWNHETPSEVLTERLREHLGLPTEDHALTDVDLRRISNDIAHANTDNALTGLPETRTIGPRRLDRLEEDRYQWDVEDALRDGDRFLVGADPRTNPYGKLINDGGPHEEVRQYNCLDQSLSALSSFYGDPQVGLPRYKDELPSGKFNAQGEHRGMKRAMYWLGDHELGWPLNSSMPVVDQFAWLHDHINQKGELSAALVVNTWHARDANGNLLYEHDGTPTLDGSHATVVVYPRGASGPVWWDPQQRTMSDKPPLDMQLDSASLSFIAIDPNGGITGAGATHQGTSGGIPPAGSHLSSEPGNQHLPDRVRMGLLDALDTGGAGRSEADSGNGGLPHSGRPDGSGDELRQREAADHLGQDVRPVDSNGRTDAGGRTDLPAPMEARGPADEGESDRNRVPGDHGVPDRTTGTDHGAPTGHQQENPAVSDEHGRNSERSPASGGLGDRQPAERDLARTPDTRVLEGARPDARPESPDVRSGGREDGGQPHPQVSETRAPESHPDQVSSKPHEVGSRPEPAEVPPTTRNVESGARVEPADAPREPGGHQPGARNEPRIDPDRPATLTPHLKDRFEQLRVSANDIFTAHSDPARASELARLRVEFGKLVDSLGLRDQENRATAWRLFGEHDAALAQYMAQNHAYLLPRAEDLAAVHVEPRIEPVGNEPIDRSLENGAPDAESPSNLHGSESHSPAEKKFRRFEDNNSGREYGEAELGPIRDALPQNELESLRSYSWNSDVNDLLRVEDPQRELDKQANALVQRDAVKEVFGGRYAPDAGKLEAHVNRADLSEAQRAAIERNRELLDEILNDPYRQGVLESIWKDAHSYEKLQQQLGTEPTVDSIRNYVDTLDRATAQPLPENVVAVRGIKSVEFMRGPDGELLGDRDPRQLEGIVQTDEGYLSTTLGAAPPGSPRYVLELEIPEGTPAVWLGRESSYPFEGELLVGRRTPYVITEVIADPHGPNATGADYLIRAKVLPHAREFEPAWVDAVESQQHSSLKPEPAEPAAKPGEVEGKPHVDSDRPATLTPHLKSRLEELRGHINDVIAAHNDLSRTDELPGLRVKLGDLVDKLGLRDQQNWETPWRLFDEHDAALAKYLQQNHEHLLPTLEDLAAVRDKPTPEAIGHETNAQPHIEDPAEQQHPESQSEHPKDEPAPENSEPRQEIPAAESPEALTHDEQSAIHRYTDPDADVYSDLNHRLRNELELEPAQQKLAADLTSGLEKLPAYDGTVWRGTHLTPEQLARYVPGAKVTEPAFSSSSRDPRRIFTSNVEFVIHSESGRDISALSARPGEQEVLFKPGTTFEVRGVVEDPNAGLFGKTRVYLYEATEHGAAHETPAEHTATPGGEIHTAEDLPVRHGRDRTALGASPEVQRVYDNVRNEGEHDVIIHGDRFGKPTADGGFEIDPQKIVEAIRDNPNYVEGTPVRLLSCHSGNDIGWAQHIANELGVPVRAPSDLVGVRAVPDSPAILHDTAEWRTFRPADTDGATPKPTVHTPTDQPDGRLPKYAEDPRENWDVLGNDKPGDETHYLTDRLAEDNPSGDHPTDREAKPDHATQEPQSASDLEREHQPIGDAADEILASPAHALIDDALREHPEIAKVVRELVDDAQHPLDLTRALMDPQRRIAALKTLAELADSHLLDNNTLPDFIAENPGHGPLFDHLPTEVNHLPDGRPRMHELVDEAKAVDPARQVGAYPDPAERVQVEDYARRLVTEVEPAVEAELARLTEGIDGAKTSLRTKSADGILDKVKRMFEGAENRAPRPHYRVGDAIDAVGARITVEHTHELALLLQRITERFGVGENSRILEIENMYATPKARNPEYRVIPLVVRIDIDGIPYTYELQLTTRRASIAADLNHNTVYKPYVDTTPEQLGKINKMFAEAAALDQMESRARDTGPLPRRNQLNNDGSRPDDQRRGSDHDPYDVAFSSLSKQLQEIFDTGTDIAGGRAYYEPNDPLLARALVAKPTYGFYTLDMHGDRTAVWYGNHALTPSEAAMLVRADPNWKNQPIVLNSCETGKGKGSFAQHLADELGVRVVAPTELVWALGDGKSVVASEAFTASGDPMPKFPPDGKWAKFKPNRKKGS